MAELDQKDPLLSNQSFPFETEDMALKGNIDYINLRQYLITLESMRAQALMDIDKLYDVQEESLSNPLKFAQRVKNGDDVGIPNRLVLPDMPEIDWSKYKVSLPMDAFRPNTRPKPQRYEDKDYVPVTVKKIDADKVRGRVRDKAKPSTYNQLWTVEEQLRLEELLIKFPAGNNEARRFKKIAEALGNRTLGQVTSRCQKYFLKLQKAGLPIPGRPPRKSNYDLVRNPRNPKYHPNKFHKSTFFPQNFPHVKIMDEDDLPGTSTIDLSLVKNEPMDSEDSSEFSDNARNTDEFRKLVLFRRVKKDLVTHGSDNKITHPGYRCNLCVEDPLHGTRWHCIQCGDGNDSVDYCSTCLISQLEGECPHPLDHHFVPCRAPVAFGTTADTDYAYNSNYNYLDPNFLPD